MRLFFATLTAAAVGIGSSFVLDTSSMTGSLSWSHANGSVAGASLRHLSTTSTEWGQVFSSLSGGLPGFSYQDSGGNWQVYNYPTNFVNGGDLPGVLTANHFGIVDYGIWPGSGTPVVGLGWDFVADATMIAAIPDHATPLSPIPASYNLFQGGHLLWDTMTLNPGGNWTTMMEYPFQDVNDITGNYGWVIVPPYATVPNSYQNRRYLLFGTLDLSDPDPNNHRVILYDGVEMSLDARVVPEPASMTALALGAIGLMVRRKKRSR